MLARLAIIGGVIVALIVGLTFFLAPDDLAGCQTIQQTDKCRASDAIVVISGGDTSSRTSEAIRLYQAGWAPYIIFSGAAADKDSPSNAIVMRRQALASGVPESATIIEEKSKTTKENAMLTKKQLEKLNAKRVILVTSGYHMRRASLEFGQQLGNQIELIRHPVASDKHWSNLWWLTPWGWWIAIGEIVKIGLFSTGASY